ESLDLLHWPGWKDHGNRQNGEPSILWPGHRRKAEGTQSPYEEIAISVAGARTFAPASVYGELRRLAAQRLRRKPPTTPSNRPHSSMKLISAWSINAASVGRIAHISMVSLRTSCGGFLSIRQGRRKPTNAVADGNGSH